MAHYWKNPISSFQEIFTSIDKIFYFGRKTWEENFWEENFFILGGNPWDNSKISYLFLIITLRFTCGERKIWSNIENSQNIMTMIVGPIFFYAV